MDSQKIVISNLLDRLEATLNKEAKVLENLQQSLKKPLSEKDRKAYLAQMNKLRGEYEAIYMELENISCLKTLNKSLNKSG